MVNCHLGGEHGQAPSHLLIRRYLAGNFAPINQTRPLTACTFSGSLPPELAGGQYVRNGGNPVSNGQLGRDAHWFDGDGMLSGVFFQQAPEGIRPAFVNQYILTDLYLASRTSPALRTPILPSIATLVNPFSSLLFILSRILRTIAIVLLSRLPGSSQVIRKISVANTALYYHDGRALATCESGPPMRIGLPRLETLGWFDGRCSESDPKFGGPGLLGFMREWTTAHPRVDPQTGEMLLFHSTFVPPYIRYSVLAPSGSGSSMLNHPIPGVASAKMMHDFGVSSTHTIIMDLPLSLDPLNLARGKPVVAYDPRLPARFGIFPRFQPQQIRWYHTTACCIFHTANCWDGKGTVHLLACRLTSASLVFSAGDLAAPQPVCAVSETEDEQCRLYYYEFDLDSDRIKEQWALAAIPFEFPSIKASVSMSVARFVYGCSVSEGSFGAALGRAVKIKSLVKMDVTQLIRRGKKNPPERVRGCVDTRNMQQITDSRDADDAIQAFVMPQGWCAQEPRFVPREHGEREDDGWLLSYVFDESTYLGSDGECRSDARSELWIIDARSMKHVVARVQLPQRVPYGLHGAWFPAQQIREQRPWQQVRRVEAWSGEGASLATRLWLPIRRAIETRLG